MAKGKSTWKYNKLLTARRNYFGNGGINWGLKKDDPNMSTSGFRGVLNSGSLSGPATAVGGMIGGAIGGGLESGAGNVIGGLADIASQIPGPWGAVAGAGLKFIGGGVNALFGSKLNEENIAAVNRGISAANNVTASATSFDDLISTMGSTADIANFSDSYIGKDGLFSNKAKRKAAELRALKDVANARQDLTMTTNAENITEDTMSDLLANYAAFGGPLIFSKGGSIHIKPENRGKFTEYCGGKVTSECIARGKRSSSPAVRKRATFAANARKWKHAFGGDLLTHGANFDTGVTLIGNGGTHEENPFEGVLMGVDQEGIPNLVEEGEVIFNDYVFSNRLKVPKEFRKKYKLGDNKALTFAKAATKMGKESEERPNDPTSQRGLQALMSDLANTQEEVRAKNPNNRFALGGKVNKYANGTSDLKTYSNFEQLGKDTDFYTDDYLNFWDYIGDPRNITEATEWLNRINSGEFGNIGGNTFSLADIQRLSRDYKRGPVHNAYLAASKEFKNSGRMSDRQVRDILLSDQDTFETKYRRLRPSAAAMGLDVTTANDAKTSRVDLPNESDESDESSAKKFPTWMRYTPAFASGIMSVTDALGLTNKPDYSEADMVLDAVRNSGSYQPVGFNPVGNYLTYTPFDREFYINQLNAQSGATRRAIMQNAGLNRGAGMAALLASDYNAQGQLGQLARQAEEYNLAQRQKVEEFNRGTNMFNTEGALKADLANQEALMKSRNSYLKGVLSAAGLRQGERQQVAAAKSANLSNFINSLGDIGRENFAMNQINDNKALLYGVTHSGTSPYKRKRRGFLTIKKNTRR